MQPDPRDRALLWDMYDYASEAMQMTSRSSFEEAKGNRELIYALRYVVFTIGEAARHLSTAFQEAHPEVEWAKIIGMRNILAHDYGTVRDDIVWDAATRGASELLGRLKPLIGDERPRF